MYRAAVRSASRQALGGMPRSAGRLAPRRFASTASPADKPRSWKSSALRWGLAVGAVYYYNTSSVFADEATVQRTVPAPSAFAESDLPTVDAVIEEKRKQVKAKAESAAPAAKQTTSEKPAAETQKQPSSEAAQNTAALEGGPAALEEEAGQEGAFNPETGEINWDCPCLGGMAHGPCGEEFKTAFSCFVYSNEEPKGMDCIEKFQGMQECFRKYPEIYGSELTDDPADEEAGSAQPEGDVQALREAHPESAAQETKAPEPATKAPESDTHAAPAVEAVDDPAPVWEDARAANDFVEKKHEEQAPKKEEAKEEAKPEAEKKE
ncbi:mitochondrial intermembrane space import and assembly protein [Purpureocillium lilacinum]|uniref:Mitochondrial intermembrane space import and assembly protein 40 n=1 Tax=Purpureocillium lilacinum TaxID=33203 RepID=A0A179GSV8_PURLI|nr:mitochondrial intermembrane space import and assembly protein [Purpureocillium lilacinum]OAQ80842.1 mitochondrial intermembrane space import and assembly protein [Purpureocillium lilacinum]PWI75646.1 intermembrane space import and assembly protein 40 [Purpureocillium lilacinum]GJN76392.1 oxidoreductase [Purpureocillium lilacinum]